MRKFISTILILAFFSSLAFAGLQVNPITGKMDKTGTNAISGIQRLNSRLNDGVWNGLRPIGNRTLAYVSSMSTSSDPSVTSRIKHPFPKGATVVSLVYGNFNSTTSTTECNNIANSIEIGAAIEYPKSTINPVTFNGQARVTIPICGMIASDPIVLYIAPGDNAWSRTFFKNNGSQTYPLNIQSLNDFSDSGRNGDNAGQLITGATNATPIVITTNGNHNVTTGMSVTIDSVLGNTAANGTWTATYISATTFSLDTSVGSGAYTSGGRLRGNDLTLVSSGVMYGNQGPVYYAPCAIIGVPVTDSITIASLGDSIIFGSDDNQANATLNGAIARTATALNVPYQNLGSGGTAVNLYSATASLPTNAKNRRTLARLADYRFNNYGTNDITFYTVANIQASLIYAWNEMYLQGKREIALTLLPKTSSTDTWTTTANQVAANSHTVTGATNASPIVITTSAGHNLTTGQTIKIRLATGNTAANGTWVITVTGANTFSLNGSTGNGVYAGSGLADAAESNRITLNAWLRDGAPMTNGVAVATGTVGATRVGDATHPLYKIYDWASNVEVNSSNVLTTDGGYWIVTGAANYATDDGTHPSPAAFTLLQNSILTADLVSY